MRFLFSEILLPQIILQLKTQDKVGLGKAQEKQRLKYVWNFESQSGRIMDSIFVCLIFYFDVDTPDSSNAELGHSDQSSH